MDHADAMLERDLREGVRTARRREIPAGAGAATHPDDVVLGEVSGDGGESGSNQVGLVRLRTGVSFASTSRNLPGPMPVG